MVRKRKKEKKEQPEPTAVFEVVSHIVQALNNPNVDMYYCDEMHFPLFQTADNHWTKPGKSAEMVYNRRAVPLPDQKLSAIAMCSLDSFCAVQIFKKDVTAEACKLGADVLTFGASAGESMVFMAFRNK